jgi:hypothetical protein
MPCHAAIIQPNKYAINQSFDKGHMMADIDEGDPKRTKEKRRAKNKWGSEGARSDFEMHTNQYYST